MAAKAPHVLVLLVMGSMVLLALFATLLMPVQSRVLHAAASGDNSVGSTADPDNSTTLLKIKVDSTKLYGSDSQLTRAQADKLVNDYMHAAVNRVSNMLQLRGSVQSSPLSQEEVGSTQECADVTNYGQAPSGLDTSEGVGDSNYVLVLYSSKDRCGQDRDVSMLAGCSLCIPVRDTKTDRPKLGMMNICPPLFTASVLGTLSETLLADHTLFHELLHCLGFSDTALPYWHDRDTGKPYDWQVYTQATSSDGLSWLSTPRVRDYAKAYFSCDKIPGGPITISDTKGLHWWPKALPGEIMVPAGDEISIDLAPVSNFTLFAMEDTGWYVPNYGAAEDYTSNKGAGCGLFGV